MMLVLEPYTSCHPSHMGELGGYWKSGAARSAIAELTCTHVPDADITTVPALVAPLEVLHELAVAPSL